MKSRILVAAILLPIVYVGLWAPWKNNLLFAILVTIACAVATLELYAMLRRYKPWVPAGLVAVAVTPLAAWAMSEAALAVSYVIVLPLTIVFASLSAQRDDQGASMVATLAPVAYLAPTAALVIVLRSAPEGFGLVLLMLLGIWANDTGAFFVGKFLGRTKLAPRISPNKTVEGFLGGFILGTVVVWYGHFLIEAQGEPILRSTDALLIGMAVALATPVGDLFESMLKRACGVKDSSHLLGEHGGALDRLDSILLATPVMYLGCFFAGVL